MRKTETILVDDLDGTTGVEIGVRTVTLVLDEIAVEIDLSEENREALHTELEPFFAKGRKITGRVKNAPRTPRGMSEQRKRTRAIREWAVGQGVEIGDRGRISQPIQVAYDAAHSS